jgi:dienelactone hydrolase
MQSSRWRIAIELKSVRSVLLFVSTVLTAASAISLTANAEPNYGPFGPEGPRLREQLWMVPGADPAVPLRATVFRPPSLAHAAAANAGTAVADDPVRHPLVVINHGSDEATREAVSLPRFFWLSKWFVDRGYVVLLPQRRGYGSTGGEFVEGRDRCASPDHYGAGMAAADDIEGALRFMEARPFIAPSQTIVVGVSTGGWAALALAARNPPGVRLVVNFAGGRGGHAYGAPHAVCAPQRLIEAVGDYGRAARVATLWFYARNDSYFGPDLATSMAQAWQRSGGAVELRLLPAYKADGHEIVDDRAAWELWSGELEGTMVRANAVGSPSNGVRVSRSH